MTPHDLSFVSRVLSAGLIHDPVLEFGVGYAGPTCKPIISAAGLNHTGTDLYCGTQVDVVADFEQVETLKRFDGLAPFGSALILNVLEHTFDPIRVLDNALTLLRPRGTMVLVTPAVWPLHDYPFDAWRLLPNFYEQYAVRRGLTLISEFFEYVSQGKVSDHRNTDGSYRFPLPGRLSTYRWYSRAVHRALNTFGRGMFQPSHIAVGCVYLLPDCRDEEYPRRLARESSQ